MQLDRSRDAGAFTHLAGETSSQAVNRSLVAGIIALCGLSTLADAAGSTAPTTGSAVESRLIYVSNSSGLDSNSGLTPTSPKRTLGAAYMELRNRSGDKMLLKRGDTWTNETLYPSDRLWGKSGYSADQPITVGAYGSGNRPVVRNSITPLRVQTSDGVSHFLVENINFQAIRDATNGPQGIVWWATGGDFEMRDCRIQNFCLNLNIDAPAPMTASDLRFTRCEILDAFPGPSGPSQGAYVANVHDVLFDQCVFDKNGYRFPDRMATMLNHNCYFSQSATGIVIQNSIVARGSATGIQLRGQRMDAINNLVLGNPLGITMGHSAQTPEQISRGVIYGNLVLDGADIGWSTNRLPRGFGISWGRVSQAVIEDNIVAHGWTQVGFEPAYTVGDFAYNTVVRNNVGVDWNGPILSIRTLLTDTAFISENTFVNMPGRTVASIDMASGVPADVGGNWGGNRYWGSGTSAFRPGQGSVSGYAVWEDRTDDVIELNDAGLTSANISMPYYLITQATHLPTPSDGAGALDAFMEEVRSRPIKDQDERFTAMGYITWARQRLGLPPLHGAPQLP